MSLHDLAPGGRIPAARDEVVVVIPLYGGHEHFVRCLSSVLAHTSADVPILVADDLGPDPASRAWAEQLACEHDVHWLRQPENLGFVGNCNAAFAATSPADVVLVNSDVVVAAGWLDGLRDAATSDSSIATASALTNHGTMLSVPHRNTPVSGLPQDTDIDAAAQRVRELSPRLRPRIPTAIGHCFYIRRSALDLAGGFDEAFAPAYGEEVDFSQRCLTMGLQHVAADDVLVLHRGNASMGKANPIQAEHDRIIASRYRYFDAEVKHAEQQRFSPLSRALTTAARAVRGFTVTIDGRCLHPRITGTQLHVLEIVGALSRRGGSRIRVVVPHDLGAYAQTTLAELDQVTVVGEQALLEDPVRSDVVHRPYQISDPRDLEYLAALGERLVVTNQDLIAYRNPSYFESPENWMSYRRLTAETMALSSLVLFFSEHAARDALSEDLVPADRTRVVLIGTDHRLVTASPQPVAPAGAPADLADRPFLLCLGTTFRHKNRVFALRLLRALRKRHDWDGRLVLAGPEVAFGSSVGDEIEWLTLNTDVAERVVRLAAVSEAEKQWLYERCAAVAYPTTYEGFGLVPFEAADAGRPCLFAPVTSLAEVLAPESALIVPWDAELSADRVIEVLRDPLAAERAVAAVREAGSRLTWDATADGLLAAYDAALALPASEMLRLEGAELATNARYWHFRNAIGPTGLSLVEPDGQLLPEEVQRTVAALARRPSTRRPLFGALRALRRVAGEDKSARRQLPAAATNGAGDEAQDDEDEPASKRDFPDAPPHY